MANTKLELAELTTETTKLKVENLLLKDSSNTKNELFFKDGLYFSENDENPYCPGCYDSENKKIRLKKAIKGFDDFGKYSCPKYGQFFGENKL